MLPSVIVTPVTNPPDTVAVPVAAAPETAVKLSPTPLAVAAALIFNNAEYVNERVFCVELAAELNTNCVPFVIDEITAFAGTPEAVIIIPTANPAVEAAFTDVDPDVTEIPPNVSVPSKLRVNPAAPVNAPVNANDAPESMCNPPSAPPNATRATLNVFAPPDTISPPPLNVRVAFPALEPTSKPLPAMFSALKARLKFTSSVVTNPVPTFTVSNPVPGFATNPRFKSVYAVEP